ncbi:MAG TPA: flagellar biosynthesis anti-sigma factor FlgM [Bryobacteraceae bacterium]|jgi:anti-sigma28 factor (negative regulator of flagellin synthesis)|nr:flagellar biosynthesis anti-sigma factor FlgM [Bryobacteraceae bacterium]
MRVEDRNLNGAGGPQPGRAPGAYETGRTGSAAGAQVTETAGGDRAEISSLAGTVSQAITTHMAERAQRVEKLAAEYRSGQYNVSARSASQALVRDALERTDAAR